MNGADTCGILKLFSANVLWTALPAVLIGAGLAYRIGMKWLEQFSESVNLSIWLFAGVIAFVLVVILVCVILKAWEVANENPVKSIKSE